VIFGGLGDKSKWGGGKRVVKTKEENRKTDQNGAIGKRPRLCQKGRKKRKKGKKKGIYRKTAPPKKSMKEKRESLGDGTR